MKYKLLSLLLISLSFCPTLFAQGRDHIKSQIERWGECKNVALTLTGGDVALYGKNGWAASSVPTGMSDALNELNGDDRLIDDVQLTEEGSWLILYGDNGVRWYDIPSGLEDKIRIMNDNDEVITSITFNDLGDWIIISQENISASSTGIYSWIQEGLDKFGALWAAHLTDDGIVLCYSEGYRFYGNVPDRLKNKLEETNLDVYRVKFLSDGAYFIADREGGFAYYF
ncbi:hypothetical protein GCM10007049_28720 [Echinicola pacifica]|uniref:WG containing repeat-containing protein n=1 Tax=Echinicola pacifica TaxID=346377 RepID=A0A918UTU3_9BACT|nr:hypothetical protein [Echinicola pacifica]GGZ33326.1 hypothetical protein GCM10007049_28720 [Echinicola pacifica]